MPRIGPYINVARLRSFRPGLALEQNPLSHDQGTPTLAWQSVIPQYQEIKGVRPCRALDDTSPPEGRELLPLPSILLFLTITRPQGLCPCAAMDYTSLTQDQGPQPLPDTGPCFIITRPRSSPPPYNLVRLHCHKTKDICLCRGFNKNALRQGQGPLPAPSTRLHCTITRSGAFARVLHWIVIHYHKNDDLCDCLALNRTSLSQD